MPRSFKLRYHLLRRLCVSIARARELAHSVAPVRSIGTSGPRARGASPCAIVLYSFATGIWVKSSAAAAPHRRIRRYVLRGLDDGTDRTILVKRGYCYFRLF